MLISTNSVTYDKPNKKTCLKSLIFLFVLIFSIHHLSAQVAFETPDYYQGYYDHLGSRPGKSFDMDGDGDLDIVYGQEQYFVFIEGSFVSSERVILIRINEGLGGFESDYIIALPSVPEDFDIGDLNNDGLPDLVVATRSHGFQVALNTTTNGILSFGALSVYSGNIKRTIVSDINGDENDDLILITGTLESQIQLSYGDGTGGNWTTDLSDTTLINSDVFLVDINGDHVADIVGINDFRKELYVYLGDSLPDGSPTGTFQTYVEFTLDQHSQGIEELAIGDFNNDGFNDLAVGEVLKSDAEIWINDGLSTGISFTEVVKLPADRSEIGFSIADMTADGINDLISVNYKSSTSGEMKIFEGNGDGTFQSPPGSYLYPITYTGIFSETYGIVTGDYNGDGLIDMGAMDQGLHVFLNNDKSSLSVTQSSAPISTGSVYDFGYVSAGTSSGTATFTITNNGSQDAQLTGIPKIQISGANPTRFIIDESSTSEMISADGGTTTFTVTYTPSLVEEGANSAIISIPSSDPLTPYVINLEGTTHMTPSSVAVGASPICDGEIVTLTQTNGTIGPGEQWVWYSGSCGGTQVGIGPSIDVSPSVTTDYFVRGETTAGAPLTAACTSGQVVVLGEILTITAPITEFKPFAGETQSITVTDTGSDPVYQWQKDGVDLVDDSRISGSQTNTLTIITLVESDQAVYTCVVSNYCSQESTNIDLEVLQLPPNDICSTVLDFDGQDDYIDFGNVINPSSGITLEAWVKIDAIGERQDVIDKSAPGGQSPFFYQYHLDIRPGGQINFALNLGGDYEFIQTTATVEANLWYHLAATYDGTNMHIYIDGSEVASRTASGSILNFTEPLKIGQSFDGASGPRPFKGQLDEVSIWDKGRTQVEIQSDFTNRLQGNEPNLIAYWNFDDGAGMSGVLDRTGNGFNGTLTNMDPATDWQTMDGAIDDDIATIDALECIQYVSPSGNFTWTTSGVYQDTLQTIMGCDSIIIVNLTIEKFDQSISFDALADMTYGDADITLSATSDSGLPVTYMSSDPTVASILGNTLTVTGGGTATIAASQVGDDCYNAAPDESQGLFINKAVLSANANDASKIYGDDNPTFTATYSGFINGDDASVIDTPPTGLTTADVTSHVGEYVISLTGGVDNSYEILPVEEGSLEITKRDLYLTAQPVTQKYGEVVPLDGFDFSAAIFVNDDDEHDLDELPMLTSPVTPTSPTSGFYTTTPEGGSDNNYNLIAFGNVHTVDPAPLTVSADNINKLQGTANPPLTFSYTGFANGEDESALTSLPSIGTTATMSSPVGNYDITLSGGSADNYEVILVNGIMNVATSFPITVTADPLTSVYGDAEPDLTYQVTSGFINPEDSFTGSLTRVSGEGVGNYAISQGTLSAGSDYDITFVSNDLSISPAPLVATADDQAKIEGTANPPLTISYAGFVNGEDISVLTSSPVINTTATLGSPIGEYPITLTGGAADNYSLTLIDGIMEVNFIVPNSNCGTVLDFNADDSYVNFGDVVEPTTAITLEAWISTDATGGRQDIIDKSAPDGTSPFYQYHLDLRDDGVVNFGMTVDGVYNFIRISDNDDKLVANQWYHVAASYDGSMMHIYIDGVLKLSKAATVGDISNYSEPLKIGQGYDNVTVGPRPFNGQIDEVRIWGDARTESELQANYLSQLTGNEPNLMGYWNFDQGKGSEYLIDQTANGNHGLLTNMDISADWQTTEGSASTNSGSTLVINDVMDYTPPSGNFTWTESGIYADIIPNQMGCDSTITVDLTVFEPISLTITADAQSKIYGDSDPSFIYQLTSGTLLPGDMITGELSRVAGEDAGTYAIEMGTLTAGSGYVVSFVSNDLTILPKVLAITANDNQSKTYGEIDPVYFYMQTGTLENGDVLTGELARVAGEDAGAYAISQGSLTVGSNYTITYQAADFIITPAPLSATANDQSRLFGSANPSLTIAYSGFVNGDDSASITEPTIATTANASSNVGMYPITLSGGSTLNYTLTLTDGTLTINQANQTITFDALGDKTQGDADFNLTASASSGLMISYSSSNTSVATVSGNTVTVLGDGTTIITASQAGDGDYTPATPVGQVLTVDELYIWNGTVWNNGAPPTSLDNALIDDDYNFSTNGSFQPNHLTIRTGALLTVDGENTLTVNGDISNSGHVHVVSGSSLVTLGNVTGAGYQIDRVTTFDASTGRYSIMGSPVESAGFSVLGSNALVYGYDQSELFNASGNAGLDRFKTPAQLSQITMNVGEGYFSAFTGDANGLVSFTGTVNTGTIHVPLAYTNQAIGAETVFQGFNLVSNPYPSAIAFTQLMSENSGADISGAIYLWDDSNSNSTRGSNADYVIVNALGSTDSQSNGLSKWDGFIRSGQGFFVQADSETSLVFNNSMRMATNNDDGGFYRQTAINKVIKLNISDQQTQKSTLIGFVEEATIGTDHSYDAASLSSSDFQLYSLEVASNNKLGIQGLPLDYQDQIKLGFSAAVGDYTLSIENVESLIDMEVVLLKDHLTNRVVNLKEESYAFTTSGGEDLNRFTLQVSSSILNSINQLKEKTFYAYSTQGQLNVVFQTVGFETADFKLIDLTGQTVFEQSAAVKSNRWNVDTSRFPEGVYLLVIKNDFGIWKGKVITK